MNKSTVLISSRIEGESAKPKILFLGETNSAIQEVLNPSGRKGKASR